MTKITEYRKMKKWIREQIDYYYNNLSCLALSEKQKEYIEYNLDMLWKIWKELSHLQERRENAKRKDNKTTPTRRSRQSEKMEND